VAAVAVGGDSVLRGGLPGLRVALALILLAGAAFGQEQPGTVRDVAVVIGRVERLDPFGRSVTIRTPEGLQHTVYAGRELKAFDELKSGDTVTVRISESVVLAVRPGAKMTAIEDSTAAAKKSPRASSADVLQQLKAVVKIETVDLDRLMVAYKTADNRNVVRQVADRRLIETLKPGDIAEITYTRERALEITKNR
jgi:hypothetical protein